VIKPTACVVVECDDCGNDYWVEHTEWGFAPHWESLETAVKELVTDIGAEADDGVTFDGPWEITGDGHAVCPPCRAGRVCADLGHDLTPLEWCSCNGLGPAHEQGCPKWSTCTRCGALETDCG
jgi:hypothetical protein